MRGLMRSPAVQAVLAWILAGWLSFCFATTRWQRVNMPAVEALWANKTPALVLFWHARIALSPVAWDYSRAHPARAMISLSPDGEFIAKAVALLGFPAIRGSSTKSTRKGEKVKGGSAAFRDALRWVKSGGVLAITPDGPRGPAEQMAEGAATLAKVAGVPVIMLGLACNPCKRLNTWDKAVVPLPFARGAIVWNDVILVDRDADVETLKVEWAARLTELTAQAEALVA